MSSPAELQQNGTLGRGPLPDIQENEPLNPQSADVKVSIRENPKVDSKQQSSLAKTVSTSTQKKSKTSRTQLERFLISTCILLSSCVVILLVLLMLQVYFTGELHYATCSLTKTVVVLCNT